MFMMVVTCAFPCYSRYYEDNVYKCEANLEIIGRALENYAGDHHGEYPPSLSYLVPRYLASIPICSTIGIDTYSCGYMPGKGEYFICCFGKNHKLLSENEPYFSSKKGKSHHNLQYLRSSDSEKTLDTATSLILLGILAVVSFLTYRKK